MKPSNTIEVQPITVESVAKSFDIPILFAKKLLGETAKLHREFSEKAGAGKFRGLTAPQWLALATEAEQAK